MRVKHAVKAATSKRELKIIVASAKDAMAKLDKARMG